MSKPDHTVLITGGAGYIGSHTCKALAARGFLPVVLDNLERGAREAVQWGPFESGDLLEPQRMDEVFARHRPSVVVHFAAYAYVGESVAEPASYYRNNISGTINLLDVMRRHGVGKIVFSSTCATYGVPDQTPIPESTEQKPINPYGRAKLMIERILSDYGLAYGLASCSLRYFNAAGADPDGQLGEEHDPEPHLIPNVLRSGLWGREPVRVFGDDYPTADGTCIRDYIHVTDLAEAHCLGLEYLKRNPGVHAFNLGSERGYSVMEVIRMAEKELESTVPYRIEERRPGDPPVLVADSSRARSVLGWTPRHSELGQIMRTAAKWERGRRRSAAP